MESATGYSYKLPERGFKQATEGKHFGKVFQVIYMGFQSGGTYQGQPLQPGPKVGINFLLADGTTLFQKYTYSNHARGLFGPAVNALMGRKHTADELNGYDVGQLVGRGAELRVEHKISSSGKVRATIKAINAVEPEDQARVDTIIPDDFAFVVPGLEADLSKFPIFAQDAYRTQLSESEYAAELAVWKAANPKKKAEAETALA